MNERKEFIEETPAPQTSFEDDVVLKMREHIDETNRMSKVEHDMLTMPLAVGDEVALRGMPEIRDAVLRGVLAVSLLASPEAVLAQQESITIPKDHIYKFERETGLNLAELARKYGILVDHSMITEGATQWVIHIGQTHGQMDDTELHPNTNAVIAESQISVYGILDDLQHSGVDTVFEEAHTNNPLDVRTIIQNACAQKRSGLEMTVDGTLFQVNNFLGTTVRDYLSEEHPVPIAQRGTKLLTKLGGASILGCEGKMRVLHAEDLETNNAMENNTGIFTDSNEIMRPYKEALADTIIRGHKETSIINFSDKKAIEDYMRAVTAFLAADMKSEHFDIDPMATLLARLSDERVRAIFMEFNERFEKTKNKVLRFDREMVALKYAGAYGQANPTKSAIPVVYGSAHNFVAAIPAYNAENITKLNYIRLNTLHKEDLADLNN
jgi:hypothetical protein